MEPSHFVPKTLSAEENPCQEIQLNLLNVSETKHPNLLQCPSVTKLYRSYNFPGKTFPRKFASLSFFCHLAFWGLMEPETRRKIEETVIDILRNSNIEEMTEFTVRFTASERLGIDLSDSEHKQFVRSVVESYLLALAEEDGNEKAPELSVPEETRMVAQEEQEEKPKKDVKEDKTDRIICQLSSRRNVVVQDFRGKTFVSIREFYNKDGKQQPTAKGISLPAEQWSAFKKSVPAIEEAIMKMEAKLGSEVCGKRTAEVPDPVLDISPSELHIKQNGGAPPELHVKENEKVCTPILVTAPAELVPVEVSRFDGKNYHSWVQQMDSFLKQLKIEYVLTEPCPNATLRTDASADEIDEAKVAEKRWMNDDFMCHHNILTSLSDHLFNKYANRKMSAKELWEELKLVYLDEEFGTKRSQVKRYIGFQMVDGKAILEQVQEFNAIADSIVAAGMMIDENFHVNVIISKLPSSWKDFSIKLMHEEHLPFWMLMERLRIEQDSRNYGNHVKQTGERSNNINCYPAKKFGPRMTDNKSLGMHRSKPEMNGKGIIVCHICGKKGHLPKNCWRRSEKQANAKRVEENVSTPAVADVNMVGVME